MESAWGYTKAAVIGGGVGAALPVAANAAVPVAMSTFGTVVAGVGTYHAPAVSPGHRFNPVVVPVAVCAGATTAGVLTYPYLRLFFSK